MKNKISIPALITIIIAASCAKKLDLAPVNALTPVTVYNSADGYLAVLAKIYGTLSITGNIGPSSDPNDPNGPDIRGGLDEGSQVAFIRGFFNCEELPTDEAVVAWNDQTIQNFHGLSWTSADPFLRGIYARPIYNITLMNEYLRQSTDDQLAANGINGADADNIKKSAAEVRFLRAYNYWVMLDLFGKSTFVTEADQVGTALPREISRDSLFLYIESELLDVQDKLSAAKTAEYGRVDQGACWSLLARLYLNAKIYTGTERNDDAIVYAKKVIDASYTLHNKYDELFMADNNKRTDEIIWAVNCDGLKTQAYGNTTFFVHCASGDDHSDYGVAGGWYGYRATQGLANLFPDLTGSTDKRALFTTSKFGTSETQIAIPALSDFNNGLHVNKYVNIRSDGAATSDPTNTFSDVDFPIFRLPEMYLIYAEATLRGGSGGTANAALGYINDIRARAGAKAITLSDLTLQEVLDERGRELYWEGHRRTDLIRYGLLTAGDYLWSWKGGVQSGTAVDSKYNIYPVPVANLTANSNLTQNPGY